MKTYFLHDRTGNLIGWIEAGDDADARAIAAELHERDEVRISPHTERDWYARREFPQEQPAPAFAA